MGTKTTGLLVDRMLEEARARGNFEEQCKHYQAIDNARGFEHAKTQEFLRNAHAEIISRETLRKASEPLIRELHDAATAMLAGSNAIIGRDGRPRFKPRPGAQHQFCLDRARLMKALETSAESCDPIPF